jgi:hypothetical protein
MSQPSLPQEWKKLYSAAMLEGDNTRIRQRIKTAGGAIHARLEELRESLSVTSEQVELQSALTFLRLLQDNLISDIECRTDDRLLS